MTSTQPQHNHRILIVDDNHAIHDDLRKILSPRANGPALEEAEAALFEQPTEDSVQRDFELVSAFQGEGAMEAVRQAVQQHKPFAMAFVDVRMPPGVDGIDATLRMWEIDPALQVVICTAYSDYSFDDMVKRLGVSDRALILKKPFDVVEVLQMACTLTEKWRLAQAAQSRVDELDRMVAERTQELSAANEKLSHDLSERQRAHERIGEFASLGLGLSAAVTVKEAALQIAEVADRMVGWDSCFCDLYLAEQNVIQHVLSIDVVEGRKTQCPAVNDQKPPTAFASRAIREGGFLLLRDSSQSMRPDGIPFGDLSRASASILFVPIRNSQRVIGILSIQSYQLNAYDEVSLEMLQALADHCGGALDRIKSQETLVATQEQLRQAQKMEAIGQLAGGIAHDFNNLLAVIRGNTDLVVIEGKAFSPRITEFLGQIVKATERAATLARQLLTFSRKQVMQVQPLCLNDLVANLTKMIKRLISAEIDLQCRFQDGLPSVNADPSMIEQVVMNLAVNARDAMPQGGRLEILTRVACLDSTFKPGRIDARAGEFVSLRVSDTGTGVAPEHLPHLFEPFFTTKGAGKGTGLGLATVYGIIKQHHGWIEVSSQVGTGTTFEIFLPAVQAARQGAIQRPVETQFALGTETILLVDDESAVRLVTRRVLENQGYRVLEAASGSEALRLWDTLQRKADLLFTDVIMPDGINGRKLADELRAKKPDLSVVYASGYTGEVLGADTEWVHQNEGFFLQKPFTRADLLQTLRRSLDTQGRGTVTATGS